MEDGRRRAEGGGRRVVLRFFCGVLILGSIRWRWGFLEKSRAKTPRRKEGLIHVGLLVGFLRDDSPQRHGGHGGRRTPQ